MKTQVLLLALCAALLVSACKPSTVECTDQQGNVMELIDAIGAAENSECGEYELQPKGAFCNDNTGTWWIPVDAVQAGCNPACVVSVTNGSSEINWRCTGLQR